MTEASEFNLNNIKALISTRWISKPLIKPCEVIVLNSSNNHISNLHAINKIVFKCLAKGSREQPIYGYSYENHLFDF